MIKTWKSHKLNRGHLLEYLRIQRINAPETAQIGMNLPQGRYADIDDFPIEVSYFVEEEKK